VDAWIYRPETFSRDEAERHAGQDHALLMALMMTND
jgi:hypothetical protein